MVEIGAVASENTNLVSGTATGASDKVDLSYSPFPGKNAAAGTTDVTMSFDDFLDMINPLEHIPVISSVYRAITGENINPVSRIAGDTLYGGVMGVVSAGLAALGAVGDETFAAYNNGQTASSSVVAFLFGKDTPETTGDTQLASSDTAPAATATAAATSNTPAPMRVAALQTVAPQQSPILQKPDLTNTPTQPPATPNTATDIAEATAAATAPVDVASNAVPGMKLDRSKMAYGGVMDSAMMQNAQQTQAMALAMTGSAGIMQAQHDLRNNRFATSSKTGVANVLASNPSAPAVSPNVQNNPQTQAALQNLLQELQAGKAINQYKNAAQMSPLPGAAVDLAN